MNLKDAKTQRITIPAYVESVATGVVDAAFRAHSQLGPGLLESVYEVCLIHALRGFKLQHQVIVPVIFEGLKLETGLRLDLLVESCLVVEVKAVEAILPVHRAQLMTYLKLAGHHLGLLINLNVPLIKDGIKRVIV
jgi:GxxExxY protein